MLRSLRALVIDDEPLLRSLMEDLLKDVLGAEDVDVADGGVAALALFDQNHYDVVLTDLLMPGMLGWEVAEALRQRDPGVKIVMLTGSPVDQDAARLRECGFPVLAKPVQLRQLTQVIEEVLAQPAAPPSS